MKKKHKIILFLSRGETIRNFVYSGIIDLIQIDLEVIIYSVVKEDFIPKKTRKNINQYHILEPYNEKKIVLLIRKIIHWAHFREQWTYTAQNHWEMHDFRAKSLSAKLKRKIIKFFAWIASYKTILYYLTLFENYITWIFRPKNIYEEEFLKIKPSFVFNCSHIHGKEAEFPIYIAKNLGFKTGTFIFSWDNLTTRSRIFPPYDYYFVWHNKMKKQLSRIYPRIIKKNILVTGTPQFDFHFNNKFFIDKNQFFKNYNLDPQRPFILYTTGIAGHFPEEHKTLVKIIDFINNIKSNPRPVLLIRPYIKDTSAAMNELRNKSNENIKFIDMLWDKDSLTPLKEDLVLFCNLLRYCSFGINAASTVSFDLMIFNKGVININFDPPNSSLPKHLKWERHIKFDHYKPIANSGAVLLSQSIDDLFDKILKLLDDPEMLLKAQTKVLDSFFDKKLDGNSAKRLANTLSSCTLK